MGEHAGSAVDAASPAFCVPSQVGQMRLKILTAILLVLSTSLGASAQPRADVSIPSSQRVIRWSATFEKNNLTAGPAAMILGPQRELSLRVTVNMPYGQPLLGWERGLESVDAVVEREGGLVPVLIAVSDVYGTSDPRLNKGEILNFRLVLKLPDGGAFGDGRYVVTVDMQPFLAALKELDGSVWVGQAQLNAQRLLVIKTPATVDERGEFHFSEAADAAMRHNDAAAIDHYLQGLRLLPERWYEYLSLGRIYVKQRRYAEALAPLEYAFSKWVKSPARQETRGFPVPLATTLIALGNDARALEVLRAEASSEGEARRIFEILKLRAKK